MTGLDMTESIAPRSDQLNADDLMTGPRTFTITKVTKGTDEQPFDFHLAEFPGRPFKPSKSMRRVMVMAWGKDASTYAGKRLRLYRDPEIMFGRDKVGGIRIEAMSDLTKPLTIALTVTRGKRAPYVVQPLPDAPAPTPANPDAITPEKVTELGAAMTNGLELADRDAKLTWLTQQLERPIKSPTELTKAEGERLLELIRTWTEPPADEPAEPTLPGADQ